MGILPLPYSARIDAINDLIDGFIKLDGGMPQAVTLANIAVSGSASDLTSGTLADARLSSNVALKNASQLFTGGNTFQATQVFESSICVGTGGTGPRIRQGFLNGSTQTFRLNNNADTARAHLEVGDIASTGTGTFASNIFAIGLRNTAGSLVLQAGPTWNDGSQIIFQNGASVIGTMQATGVAINVPATFNGNVTAGFNGVAGGIFNAQGTTYTGYYEWRKNGVRQGYIGYDAGNDITLTNERGGNFAVVGGFSVSGQSTFNNMITTVDSGGGTSTINGRYINFPGTDGYITSAGSIVIETGLSVTNSIVDFAGNTWHTGGGSQRFYHSFDGRSFYKATGTGNIHEFRNGSDVALTRMSNTGELKAASAIAANNINADIAALGSGIAYYGLGHTTLYGATSGVGAQIYLGDINFSNSAYWNSAPGIGAVGGSPTNELAFYVYTGNVNSRTEAGRFKSTLTLQIGGTSGLGLKTDTGRLSVRNSTDTGLGEFWAKEVFANDMLHLFNPVHSGNQWFRMFTSNGITTTDFLKIDSANTGAEWRFRRDGMFTSFGGVTTGNDASGVGVYTSTIRHPGDGQLFIDSLGASGSILLRTNLGGQTGLLVGSSANVQFRNGNWHGSISDGLDRFLFTASGTSYWKGHGTGTVHEWRNGSDSNIMNLNSSGELRTAGYTYVPGMRVQSTGDGPATIMGLGTLSIGGASSQLIIQGRDAVNNSDTSILYRNGGLFRIYHTGNDVFTLNNSGDVITNGYVKIGGTSGPLLKNSSGTLQVRNSADSAFAPIHASDATLTGVLTLPNATYIKTADTLDRIAFTANSRTIYRGYGTFPHDWRDASGSSIMQLITGGSLICGGAITSGSGSSLGGVSQSNGLRGTTNFNDSSGVVLGVFNPTDIEFRAGNASFYGGVGLRGTPAADNRTGRVTWYKLSGTRQGYMGYDAGNDITLVNEQGGRFIAQTTGVQVGASGPFLKNASGVLDIRDTADAGYVRVRAGEYWLGGNSYSRVAQLNTSSGGWVGGYNINYNGNVVNRDSTGFVSGIAYESNEIRFYSAASAAPGPISPIATFTGSQTTLNGGEFRMISGGSFYVNCGSPGSVSITTTTGSFVTSAEWYIMSTGAHYFGSSSGSLSFFLTLDATRADFTRPIRLGSSGPTIKNSSGVLHVRNSADSAFANIEAANGTFSGHITSAFQSLSADPSTADLSAGQERLVKNTTSGQIRRFVNDGGTIKKSPEYTI